MILYRYTCYTHHKITKMYKRRVYLFKISYRLSKGLTNIVFLMIYQHLMLYTS